MQEASDQTTSDNKGYHMADPNQNEDSPEGLSEATQEALAAINAYSPDFAMSDIALPEGIEATEEGLMGSDPIILLASGQKGSGDNVSYKVEDLGYVAKSAADVASFGKNIYDIAKGGTSGYLAAIMTGGKALFYLTGAIGDHEDEVTNADLREDMRELHSLMADMSNRLDDDTRAIYQTRLTPFDNALGALNVECAKVEQMYKSGYELGLERGLIEAEEPKEPEPEEMPAEPDEPTLPEEPDQDFKLPEEPALELPDEPISWYDLMQKSYNSEVADDAWWRLLDQWADRYGIDRLDYVFDYQTRQQQYAQAHEAWEEECARLRADHEPVVAEWEAACEAAQAAHDAKIEEWKAECDRLNTKHEQDIADWEAECKATEERNEKAKADYETALKEWQETYGDLSKIMVKLCRDEDAAGNSDFRDYNELMSSIRKNFILTAVECAKPVASSPFYAYDSYWDLHFNWHTEGYYLRQAYRSNAEYQLKRAYALLAIHYDLAKELEKDPDEPITSQLIAAFEGIDALPAGTDPATIDATKGYEVLCNVNGKIATKGQGGGAEDFSYASDDQIKEYVRRLHGNSVLDDLKLAGIYDPGMEAQSWNDAQGRGWFPPCGIAFRAERGKSKAHARILTWEGKVVSKATATKADDHWSIYTDWGPDGVGTYWWFTFK